MEQIKLIAINEKEGKYLTPSNKKLHFNPEVSQRHVENKKLDGKRANNAYNKYEQCVWREVAAENYSFHNIKKEIQRMWKKLTVNEKEEYLQRISKEDNDDGRKQFVGTRIAFKTNHQASRCICRKRRDVATISCTICQELFHCDCVDFCESFAEIRETTYFCANCINVNFVPFLHFIWTSTSSSNLADTKIISDLYEEYSSCNQKQIPYESAGGNVVSSTAEQQFSFPNLIKPDRGIENKNANCWLNSVLHCIASTPLLNLLNKWNTESQSSGLIRVTSTSLETLRNSSNKEPPVSLHDGPLAVAQVIGMVPNKTEHKDACEFFNRFLNDLSSEMPIDGSEELRSVFQWKILSLNRCLVPECEKISGRNVVMWNYPVHIYQLLQTPLICSPCHGPIQMVVSRQRMTKCADAAIANQLPTTLNLWKLFQKC